MSALMDALMGLLSGAGAVLDTPGSIVRNSLAGENPFKGLFEPEERTTGRDMLQTWGIVGENDPDRWFEGGDIAGFGAELVTDPLNLLGLGLTSKAAKGAKAARFANEGISAQNAGIIRGNEKLSAYNAGVESENAISQAMRAKGALPEELFKDARLFRTGIQDARDLDNLHEVPGVIGMAPTKLPRTNPRYIPEAYKKFNNDTLKFEEPLVPWPELRTLDNDTLLDVQDVIETLKITPAGSRAAVLESGRAKDALREFAERLRKTDGQDPNSIRKSRDIADDAYKNAYPELLRMIDEDQLVRAGDDFSINLHTPQDLYPQILKDPSDPMHGYLSNYEQLGKIKGGLSREVDRIYHPPAYADQSFYVTPNPDYIDPDLHRMLIADDFPQTITDRLDQAVHHREFNPDLFPDALLSAMTEAQQYMKWDDAERLMSQLEGGRYMPDLYSDVFEGGKTFLPYVAPALRDTLSLRETLPLMDVPKMPSKLLKALLAYNAAQTAGGY